MEALVEDLLALSLQEDVDGIEKALAKLSAAENGASADCKDAFMQLLKRNHKRINLLAAKTIAEITKLPEQRTKFSSADILKKLMEILDASIKLEKNTENVELIIQLCRALGNIFYSNDDSRSVIFQFDGGKVLVDLFNISRDSIKDSAQLETFAKVRCGVVSNYLLGTEELSQKAIELQIIDKIYKRLQDSNEQPEHLLPIFSILIEQLSDLIFKPEILLLIVNTLKRTSDPELSEMCLELLQCQAESDDVKLLLAKEDLCEHIFRSTGKFKDLSEKSEETKHLMKQACDLIVLVLTGDEAMHYLENASLLPHIKAWLDSDDADLISTSVLALGNFARTDENCTQLVKDKVHVKLIEVLARNNGPDSDVRLQHALLSAIRNLVIPKPNKLAVIDAGLLDIALPMLEIHQPPVVFKLLGTLRMLIDGQDDLSIKLLQDEKLIGLLVHWAQKTPDMVGVNSEASRLMAWLIKNGYRSRSAENNSPTIKSLETFVQVDGAVDVLVKMLDSAHLVMQNEALMSLTLLSTFLTNENVSLNHKLISASLGSTLADFIQRTSEMERTSNEILENLSTLISTLARSEELKRHLSEHKIDEKLKIVPRIRELATL